MPRAGEARIKFIKIQKFTLFYRSNGLPNLVFLCNVREILFISLWLFLKLNMSSSLFAAPFPLPQAGISAEHDTLACGKNKLKQQPSCRLAAGAHKACCAVADSPGDKAA